MVLTSSSDQTVRLWTYDGHYVGVFGQAKPWVLHDPLTYSHPAIPPDILTAPVEIPNLFDTNFNSRKTELDSSDSGLHTEEIDSGNDSSVDDSKTDDGDDEDIRVMINQESFRTASGKRLRQERRNARIHARTTAGPSEYHKLRWISLGDETPFQQMLRVNTGASTQRQRPWSAKI